MLLFHFSLKCAHLKLKLQPIDHLFVQMAYVPPAYFQYFKVKQSFGKHR